MFTTCIDIVMMMMMMMKLTLMMMTMVAFIQRYTPLSSRLTALMSHVILNE